MNDTVGERREVWDRDRVRSIWRSPRYHGAVFNPEAFSFHSLNFSRGIAAMVEATGGRVYEDTPVRSIYLRAEPKLIRTDRGTVSADEVVICCSGYIYGLFGRLSRAILPIRTYVWPTEQVRALLTGHDGPPNAACPATLSHQT